MVPGSEEKKVKFADMLFTNMSNLRDAVEESERKEKEEEESLKDPIVRARKEIEEQQIRKQQEIKSKALSISKHVIQKAKNTFEQSILIEQ